MAIPPSIPGTPDPNSAPRSGAKGILGAENRSQVEKRGVAAPDGAAFRALLEKLELQAQELKNQASGVEKPDDLAGAVGNAQESLEQALSLSNQLVEAYRQSLQQDRGEPDQKPK